MARRLVTKTAQKPAVPRLLAGLMLLQLLFSVLSPAQSAVPAATPAPQQTAPVSSTNEPSFQTTEPGAAPPPTLTAKVAPTPLTRDEQILQLLNRFTYGPRPGDLERIRTIGVNAWLSGQFNPWKLDDSALDARLADYPAMRMSTQDLMEQFPNNQLVRAALAGRLGVPRGEAEKAIYRAQTERMEKRKSGDTDKTPAPEIAPTPEQTSALLAMEPKARFSALCRLTPAQLGLLRRGLPPEQRGQLTAGFTARQLEELAAIASPQGLVGSELVQTKLLRDIYSVRQLNELMVDFWLNHFNVYLRKSPEAPYFITAYERDTIRPHALGRFEDLLKATAQSPAMLNYLDNASSIGPNSDFTQRRRFTPGGDKTEVGLNENYAREVMELHTLGVNGGYTQRDVTEVAKVFTGWTLVRIPGQEGGPPTRPAFDSSKHEPGSKVVLGVTIKQDGVLEGVRVLHLLATSPQTAHFICRKLAVRFVSDDPPPALVERMAQTFLTTQGDIRLVLLTMAQSPEFFSRATYHDKVKTPQDYVVSAVRASGAEVRSASALAAAVAELGMPVFGMQTPNGYSMRADPWNNTAALVNRMNFALALSTNRVGGVRTDWPALVGSSPAGGTPEGKTTVLEDKLLHETVSDRTRATILTQITLPPEQQSATLRQITGQNGGRDALTALRLNPPVASDTPLDPQTSLAAALLFGSPEFQRR